MKKNLPEVTTELVPWKDIPGVGPEVSGVGRYTAHVTLPEDYQSDENHGAYLKMTSVCHSTVAVYVNGEKTGATDFDGLCPEVGPYLRAGDNEITVEVSTTLNNRLIQRGYYDHSVAMSMALAANANNGNMDDDAAASDQDTQEEDAAPMGGMGDVITGNVHVRDYGMVGKTSLVTYKKA